MLLPLLEATADAATDVGTRSPFTSVLYWVFMIGIIVVFYFVMLRPQKKQQKEQEAMLNALKPGDSIMTTSGFYGIVLDIVEDTVIVEFGNNKNCRIPMNKAAIAQVERPDEAGEEDTDTSKENKEDKKEKKSKLSLGKKKEDE